MNIITDAVACIVIAVDLDIFRHSPLCKTLEDWEIGHTDKETSYAEVRWNSASGDSLLAWMKTVGGPMLALGANMVSVEITDDTNGVTGTLEHAYGVTKATTEFDDTMLMGAAADKINKIREIVG